MLKMAIAIALMIVQTLPAGAALLRLDKSGDEELQAMIAETAPKFNQISYGGASYGVSLKCNMFLPEGYPGTGKYPLVVFIADGGTAGLETDAPLKQGYGGIIWAADAQQKKDKCIVLVPQYPQIIVDDKSGKTAAEYLSMTESLIRAVSEGFQIDKDRIYITGQAMGCMAAMAIASKSPDLFAAELFVAGQGDLPELNALLKEPFFYMVAEGDDKARAAQERLINRFRLAGAAVSNAFEWDARMTQDGFERAVNVILSGSPRAKFVRFIRGTVLPKTAAPGTSEHEYSFDVAYKIDAVRDWLLMQGKK